MCSVPHARLACIWYPCVLPMDTIRLLLVDHHTLLRRALASVLNRRRGFSVVGEAATAMQALEQAHAVRPDIAVIDQDVPGGGAELVSDLSRLVPQSGIVVLAANGEPGAATRALLAGARGYLYKTCEPEDLFRAIDRVHRGELMMASGVAEGIVQDMKSDPEGESVTDTLTARELEVLRLAAHGLTNAGIARELCISDHTAKGHLAKILSKLGVDNRVQLATYAAQHGIVVPAHDQNASNRTESSTTGRGSRSGR